MGDGSAKAVGLSLAKETQSVLLDRFAVSCLKNTDLSPWLQSRLLTSLGCSSPLSRNSNWTVSGRIHSLPASVLHLFLGC